MAPIEETVPLGETRVLRSRRETRAAVLAALRVAQALSRPDIADRVGLSEASVFRIIDDLKREGVVAETRRTAPYPGGPSAFMALSGALHAAVLEASSNRLYAAIGTLTGELLHARVHDLPDGMQAPAVHAVFDAAARDLAAFAIARGLSLEQVALAVPGYHPGRVGNPILALDAAVFTARLASVWPNVPVTIANSVVARAVAQRALFSSDPQRAPTFFVYAGHGVGAALVDPIGDIRPLELGHVVIAPRGRVCRCGHSGCLETLVSSTAIAAYLGVAERELFELDEASLGALLAGASTGERILDTMRVLGRAIGNALNLVGPRPVAIAGWPAAAGEAGAAALRSAIGSALLGGADAVEVAFLRDSLGREPIAGLALAGFAFAQRGGERVNHVAEAPPGAGAVTTMPRMRVKKGSTG